MWLLLYSCLSVSPPPGDSRGVIHHAFGHRLATATAAAAATSQSPAGINPFQNLAKHEEHSGSRQGSSSSAPVPALQHNSSDSSVQ